MKNADNISTVKDEFSEKIGRLTKSAAYLDFCEEVYGYRAYLFNMTDKEQLDYIFNLIPLNAKDSVLDVGCGCGSILDVIIKKYGCQGTGIDLLDSIITNNNQMNYVCANIDSITDFTPKPSLILAVDSLYFSKDLNKLVKTLTGICSKFCFFYSQYLFDESGDKTVLQNNNTLLAKALNNCGIPFKTIDFSQNEYNLYLGMKSALNKYKQSFWAENNSDLYEQKLIEVNMGLKLFQKKLAKRYMYISTEDTV